MKKIFLFLILVSLLSFQVDAYTWKTKLYDNFMNFELRPVLDKDKEWVSKNLDQIGKNLELINCSNNLNEVSSKLKRYQKELNSFNYFDLKIDFNMFKKKVFLLYQEVNLIKRRCLKTEFIPNNFKEFIFNPDSGNNVNLTGENYFVKITNKGDKEVSPVLLINKRDWSNLNTLMFSVVNSSMNDKEKALAIWEFVKNNRYHQDSPLEYQQRVSVDILNTIGFGNCGTATNLVVDLATIAGLDAREHRLGGHIISEVFFDNKWNILDADGKCVYLNPDGTFASVDDLENNISILNSCDSEVYDYEYLEKAYASPNNNKVYAYKAKDRDKQFKYILRPDETVVFQKYNTGKYFSATNYSEPKFYSNSYFVYKPKNNNKKIEFDYPYPLVGGILSGYSDSKIKIYFLDEKGVPVKIFQGKGEILIDFSKHFRNGYGFPQFTYTLKFSNEIDKLNIYTEVQTASSSLPLLKKGENLVELEGKDLELTFGVS